MITKEEILTICYEDIKSQWKNTGNTYTDFLPMFSPEQQAENVALLKEYFPMLKKAFIAPRKSISGEQRKQMRETIYEIVRKENILQIREHFTPKMIQEFEESISTFLEKSMSFDAELANENIWQAMRNFIIYCMLVNLQDEKQNCRDTIWGYTLLYPYTDNYIDEFHRNAKDKNAYNRLIEGVLSGENVTPTNRLESKTKELLEMVLRCYNDNPEKKQQVSWFLLLILDAQVQSLSQIELNENCESSYEDVLDVTIYKGGAAVLIDYLFSLDFDTDRATRDEMIFYLKIGFILQLIDDLQDIGEDERGQTRTIMTLCQTQQELEQTIYQTLRFIKDTILSFEPKNNILKLFLYKNCLLVCLLALAKNHKYVSEEFAKQMEKHLPIPLSFFEKM